MIYVEAIKQGYFKSKIREIGDKFGIDSVSQFSKGMRSRKGYDALGWMKLISISKDHEESSKELSDRLAEVVKTQKALAKKQASDDSDVDEDQMIDLNDLTDTTEADAEQARLAEEAEQKRIDDEAKAEEEAQAEALKAAEAKAEEEAQAEAKRLEDEAKTGDETETVHTDEAI